MRNRDTIFEENVMLLLEANHDTICG